MPGSLVGLCPGHGAVSTARYVARSPGHGTISRLHFPTITSHDLSNEPHPVTPCSKLPHDHRECNRAVECGLAYEIGPLIGMAHHRGEGDWWLLECEFDQIDVEVIAVRCSGAVMPLELIEARPAATVEWESQIAAKAPSQGRAAMR